jgi:hypothetical protein
VTSMPRHRARLKPHSHIFPATLPASAMRCTPNGAAGASRNHESWRACNACMGRLGGGNGVVGVEWRGGSREKSRSISQVRKGEEPKERNGRGREKRKDRERAALQKHMMMSLCRASHPSPRKRQSRTKSTRAKKEHKTKKKTGKAPQNLGVRNTGTPAAVLHRRQRGTSIGV